METYPKALRIAGGLAICTAGGALFAWLGTPLPWMIGSMLAMAAAQMAGARFEVLPGAREAAFLVVGIALGLYFTAPVVAEVARYWPWFVALGFAANGFGTLSAFVLARLSGSDRATAYFGSMPGGASEMALLGEQFGAAPERVALAHSVRMLLVVTVFPVGITLAGFSATEEYRPVAVAFDAGRLALLAALALAAGLVARRLRAPTAFMMGPLLLTIALTASGVTFSSMPTPLVNAAQVILGGVLGSRFERSFLTTAPRFVMALVPSVGITLVAAALVGIGISVGSGAYVGSALLAAAPGGIAEMSITAKVLRIGVAFVTAAHVIRYVIVVLLTVPVFRLIDRVRPR
ncbi:MAG TPA: AbrB family transcriptional regulator [Usitatibacter sp.]|nr:AbrB family transcriptional regulator [Usitatibacter sp.]